MKLLWNFTQLIQKEKESSYINEYHSTINLDIQLMNFLFQMNPSLLYLIKLLFCLRRFHGLVNLLSIWSLTINLYDFLSKRTSFKSLLPCSKVNVTFENIIYCCKCSPKLLSATQCCFNVPLVQNHFEIN